MSHRKLLNLSLLLLIVSGLRSASNFPAIFASAQASNAPAAFSSGRIGGALFGTLIWFFLALAQWRNRGRWGLGIGIYAVVVLIFQSGMMFLAVNSGRVSLDPVSAGKSIFFTLFVLGTLALVNFKLNAGQKKNPA